MRSLSRRAEFALRREIRLCDGVTFARLSRARDYLGACFRDRVTLERAASHACLSPFHFNRLFTQTFGETPHEFVTRIRMEEAKKAAAGREIIALRIFAFTWVTKVWDRLA